MAIAILVEPAYALEGGLKSNRAGIRCIRGVAVVVCFGEMQAVRIMSKVEIEKIFFIQKKF